MMNFRDSAQEVITISFDTICDAMRKICSEYAQHYACAYAAAAASQREIMTPCEFASNDKRLQQSDSKTFRHSLN